MRSTIIVFFFIFCLTAMWGEPMGDTQATTDIFRVNTLIKDGYYLDGAGRQKIQELAKILTPIDRKLLYDTYSQYGSDGILAKSRMNPFPKFGMTQDRLVYLSIGVSVLGLGIAADYYASSHDSGEARIVNPWLFGTAVVGLVGDIAYLFIVGEMINRSEDALLQESLFLGGL